MSAPGTPEHPDRPHATGPAEDAVDLPDPTDPRDPTDAAHTDGTDPGTAPGGAPEPAGRRRATLPRSRTTALASPLESLPRGKALLGPVAVVAVFAAALTAGFVSIDHDTRRQVAQSTPPTVGSVLSDDPPASAAPGESPATAVGPTSAEDHAQPLAKFNTPKMRTKRERIEAAAALAAIPPATFRAATLNVLGASHTAAGGNKPAYRSGDDRMAGAVGLLRSYDISVAALQEFEDSQKGAFDRLTGDSWSRFAADSKARDSVVWRTDTWDFRDAGTVAIPYFRGNPAPMPWVLLQHKQTQRYLVAISVHNPTSNARRGNNQVHRTRATNIQIDLVRSALRNNPGVPIGVLLMGDFNEKAEAFCQVTEGGDIIAANGGSNSPDTACAPPAGAGIDWIFGAGGVSFSDYQRIDGPAINSITDHPFVVATTTLDE